MVQVRLFGGVGATDGGRPIDLGPAKRRAVLAALALSASAAVPVSRLVELVWGPDPPRTASKTLQAHVARLRAALGPDCITRVGAAYRLDVPADAVDVLRFQQRLDAGDVDGALDQWAGAPLVGLDADGFVATVNRLEEQWLGATETRLARLAVTDPAAAVGPLTELTATHPFREELWASLMTALYRVGRQADALAAYRTARRQLDEQLGVEPGERLRELEAAILNNDDKLGSSPVSARPEGRTSVSLPTPSSSLVGREADCQAVQEEFAAARVVTLLGPGGIGKTRMALEVAHAVADQRPDGAWFIDLTTVEGAGDVPRVMADVLGVIERPGRTITAAIVGTLRDRRALLVVDNCEHVLATAAQTVAAVVAGCPDVHVLATSRQRLGIDGEHVFVVPPLEARPGAELFIDRAAAVAATSTPPVDGDVVAEICRRLDGIPLAIELAAARTRALAPADLLAHLDDALRLLGDGRRDDAPHHRALRATIQWSYDLLEPAERAVLQRLSIFAGTFDLAAAEDVAAGGGLDAIDVAMSLSRLTDQSMVLVEATRMGRRFRLLDAVRRFAAEHLGETTAVALAERHARWCASETAHIGQLLAGPDEVDGVDRLDGIWPNLRSALDHAFLVRNRDLADALLRPIIGEIILRSRVEIGDWVERLLGITPAEDEEAVAVAFSWAAQRYAITQDPTGFEQLASRHDAPVHVLVRHARAFAHDDYPALVELGPQAVDELHRQGQHHLAELTEPDRGVALLNLGRLDEVDAHVEPLVKRYRAQGPPTLLNWTLMLLGYAAAFRGDTERSDQMFAAAIEVSIPPRTHTPNRTIEAGFAWRRGDSRTAIALLRQHADELLATGNMQAASLVALELVPMLTSIGRLTDAARTLGYLQATHLLDAPGFAARIADSVNMLNDDPALNGELAEGRGLDDQTALADMRKILTAIRT